jgi:hypothetical protein
MFGTLSRSWSLAKLSYSILWRNKNLLIFPLVSSIATILVLASFLLPLWSSGLMESWLATEEGSETAGQKTVMYAILFLFYLATYFVIVFFNCGLIACSMQALRGERASVGYGFSAAAKRLPQIFGWALLSACVGVVLRAIENIHEKAGQVVSAILGTAWTAMTYFVVPTIVMEGLGPVASVKASLSNLKRTWGEALVSNFSLGLITFLLGIPVVLAAGGLVYLGVSAGSQMAVILFFAAAAVLIILLALASSAADTILKAVMYNFATGRDMPAFVDTNEIRDAFVHRDEKKKR